MDCIRSFKHIKKQRQLYYEPDCQKDTKTGRYKCKQIPSSRSAQERANLGLVIVRMEIPGRVQYSYLIVCASACSLFLLVKRLRSENADSWVKRKPGVND